MITFIINIIIAGVAGWLAGKIMHYDKSTLINILLGFVGGIIGDIVLGIIGIHGSGIIGSIIVSVVGACILVFFARLITSK